MMSHSRRSRLSSTNSSQALLSSESSDLLDVKSQVHSKRSSLDSDDLPLDSVSSSAYNDFNGGEAQIQNTLPKRIPSADLSDDTDLDSDANTYQSLTDKVYPPVIQSKLYIENETRSEKSGKRKIRKYKRRPSGGQSRSRSDVRVDYLIEEYQRLTTENKKLKGYYTKHNLLMVVLIVVCLLFILTVGLLYFLRQKQPDNKMCLDCTILSDVLREDDFQALVTIDKPGVCCVNDPTKLIERAIEKTEKLGPWADQVFEGLNNVINNLKANATNNEQLLEDLKSIQSLRTAGKVSIHLEGKYNRQRRQIQWESSAEASLLHLTSDRSSVVVSDSGNYCIYAHIKFIVPSNYKYTRLLKYKIYQKTKQGAHRVLEEVSHTADANSTTDDVCSTLRVAKFIEGDQIFLQVDARSTPALSTEEHVHEFGMFKL